MLGKKGRYEAFFFVDFILGRWVLICDMFLTFGRRLLQSAINFAWGPSDMYLADRLSTMGV